MAILVDMGYDTEDLTQWTTTQFKDAARQLTWDDTRTRPGDGFSGKFEVAENDRPVPGGERGEVAHNYIPPVGSNGVEAVYGDDGLPVGQGWDMYCGWSTYFDSVEFTRDTRTGKKNIFTQWHEKAAGFSVPPIRFGISTDGSDKVRLSVAGGPGPTYPVTKFDLFDWNAAAQDRWIDFVFRCLWHPDPAEGLVQCWIDGEEVVPETNLATMYTGIRIYFKQGYYRDVWTGGPTVHIWHDMTAIGESYADVDPARAFEAPEEPDPPEEGVEPVGPIRLARRGLS